ncbi:MAG: exodeoxyribonuclease VII small subunit [Actinobacteria bacterium]|nr:exodeoxyribonuclease VII small subunit [Actinomycetota bacterium]MCL5888243.1 exodeoxyribonuclease VII small subunit [Actinomycetota bacterium]
MLQPNDEVQGLTFGEAISEIETIVAALESGRLELEESLERYERGVALVRFVQTSLSQAQQRVTMLVGELESEAEGDLTSGPSE